MLYLWDFKLFLIMKQSRHAQTKTKLCPPFFHVPVNERQLYYIYPTAKETRKHVTFKLIENKIC